MPLFKTVCLAKFTSKIYVLRWLLFQYFILALLKKWGYDGFLKNTEQKKEECLISAEKYLKGIIFLLG